MVVCNCTLAAVITVDSRYSSFFCFTVENTFCSIGLFSYTIHLRAVHPARRKGLIEHYK